MPTKPAIIAPPAPSKPLEATVFVAAYNARSEVKNSADLVCTGTNDDQTIEQAISMLPTSGGTVKLSEGDFILGSTIDILRSGVRLEGSGFGTTIKGAISADYIRVGNGTNYFENISITNLKVDGTGSSGYAIAFQGPSNLPLKFCSINACLFIFSPIMLSYCQNFVISDNFFRETGSFCISVFNSSHILLFGNVAYYPAGLAELSSCSSCTIANNTLVAGTYGLRLSLSNYCTVVGNVFYTPAGVSGIRDTGDYNTINSNVSTGIDVSGLNTVLIGNIIL